VTRVVTEAVVDQAAADRARQPRTGLVVEREAGDGSFEAESGPVRWYRRSVDTSPLTPGEVALTETVDYSLAVPYFGWLFHFPVKWTMRSVAMLGREPRWWRLLGPGAHLDERSSRVLATLAAAAVITGYLNTLLSQTLTFAATEFDSSDAAQGATGFAVRLGGMLAFALVGLADRRGRRGILLALLTTGCIAAATGAVAPSLPWLAGSQLVARLFATSLIALIPIVAAEEMPAGSRAWATSLLALAGGLGAGMCVLSLPLADLGVTGWRLVYLMPLLGVLLLPGIARRLPESKRFVRPHTEVTLGSHSNRFWLLAASLFFSNLLVAPASLFGNRYLDDELGFSASMITVFTVLTATPAAIGVMLGGHLADVHGRRRIGAFSTGVGGMLAASVFFLSGAPLWIVALISGIVNGLAIPALTVYGPELFPTSLRGRANGLIGTCGLAGSGIGLLVAGFGSDAIGRLGPPMALLAVGPLVVCVLVLVAYPETARRELEELNPEDAAVPAPPPSVSG
jgi:MFS family permease